MSFYQASLLRNDALLEFFSHLSSTPYHVLVKPGNRVLKGQMPWHFVSLNKWLWIVLQSLAQNVVRGSPRFLGVLRAVPGFLLLAAGRNRLISWRAFVHEAAPSFSTEGFRLSVTPLPFPMRRKCTEAVFPVDSGWSWLIHLCSKVCLLWLL